MTLGFIGGGNMATAMLKGILQQGMFKKEEVFVSDVLEEAREKLKADLGVNVTADNKEVVKYADVLIFAIKPFYFSEALSEIRSVVREDQLLISIAAGVTIENIKDMLKGSYKIVRAMPNTPALVGCGTAGLCHSDEVTEEDMAFAVSLFESFGIARCVDESMMDTVVGVSGSSPAYVFMLIEAMADAAVVDGMPRKMAYEMAAQAVMGSAKMVLETGKHPGELKDMVCSPKGTTIDAVAVLEKRGFRSAIIEAQTACVAKSKSM